MNFKLFLMGMTKILMGFLCMGAMLFIPAGTLKYWNAWLLLGLLFLPMLIVRHFLDDKKSKSFKKAFKC